MPEYRFAIGDVVYLKHARPPYPLLVVDMIEYGEHYVVVAFEHNNNVTEHILSSGSLVKPQAKDVKQI